VYSVVDYLRMLADDARVAAYRRAIHALVRPGDRVLEIGAGFGYFSLIAVQAGAAVVEAIETNPVVHLGPRVAQLNGAHARIRFHQADAMSFVPDAPFDVIVADVRGPTPFAGRSLEVLSHARGRCLRAGGVMIAARDDLYCAPVKAPSYLRDISAVLESPNVQLGAITPVVLDTPVQCRIAPEDLLTAPERWGSVDYIALSGAHYSGTCNVRFAQPAEAAGLAVWFDSDVGGGATLSNAPGRRDNVYAQMFLPFRAPLRLRAGERMHVELGARAVAGDYIWEWKATVTDAHSRERLRVAQNSLAARIIDPGALQGPL
jgi:protein arginine N-methyltransferase 1